MPNEDSLTAGYKYAWSACGASEPEITLQDFLTKYRPSMVQNDGTKPWIWVQGSKPSQSDTGTEEATKEATKLLKEVTEKVENIKNDESIPVRSNKKTGAKSKKEVREQVQAEASEQLKEISLKHGYLSGKWLIFAPPDKVDLIWSNIAASLVAGPLAQTSAFLTKVSTSPEQESTNAQHIICLYLPNVYDKASVTEVMRILLRNHGVILSGVKSDLYTAIGLDSKHLSGIPSTVWKNAAILPEKEIKELKDAFFTELQEASTRLAQSPKTQVPDPKAEPSQAPSKAKGKLKMKLKAKVQDDPFASDEGETPGTDMKPKNTTSLKTELPQSSQAESSAETKPQRAPKETDMKKRAKDDSYDELEEEEMPKKKRGRN